MTRLRWNSIPNPAFEAGVDRGVLYVQGMAGVAWPGLISVTQQPTGGEPKAFYIDGMKYLNLASLEEFAGTIDAYYSPREFDYCDGARWANDVVRLSNGNRRAFGFSFRTKTNDGYKLHMVYNAVASPTVRPYQTLSDSPEAMVLSWSVSTTAVPIAGLAHTAHVTIDRSRVDLDHLAELEDILYGENAPPRLPLPNEVLSIFMGPDPFSVHDNGDGTFTATGLSGYVSIVSADEYALRSASITPKRNGRYEIEQATR